LGVNTSSCGGKKTKFFKQNREVELPDEPKKVSVRRYQERRFGTNRHVKTYPNSY
jgi:hypothetical protein